MGIFSNTTGPGGGFKANNEANDDFEQANVVAALSQHTSAAIPIAALALPSGKPHLTNTSSTTSSSSAKQFLTRRVRSTSKTDAESVSDKSIFSRIFSKKSKKPLGTLITTTTKEIDLGINKNRPNLITQSSLKANKPRSTLDKECDYGDDDVLDSSTGFLSDTDEQDNEVKPSHRFNTVRTKSSTDNKSNVAGTSTPIPTSDSQYYASLSSAPTGYSISYHKRMTKGNDDLRLQAAFGRYQQQNKKGVAIPSDGGGASQLMVCHTLYSRLLSFLFLPFRSLSSLCFARVYRIRV